MSERDVYSLIERAIRDGKRRIGEGDRQLIGPILAAYQDARNTIAAELYMLEQQILWSIENNRGELTEAWVRRQAFYERLDATIIREAERLEATVRRATIDGMALGAAEGTVTGTATLRAIPWANIPPNVLTQWTAAVTPGSPVDRVLRGYGATVETSLRTEITRGLIQKQGSSNIVRTIMNDVGDYIPESNASRIVRTETMRAYRGVYREQMDAIPRQMIEGYRWVAGMDLRTCPICLGLHGQIFKEYPTYQHVMCRCTVSVVFTDRYAPPRHMETGEEWLRKQPEDVQRERLGPGRYELWKDGTPLPAMIRFENDPVWGGTSRLIPLRELQP